MTPKRQLALLLLISPLFILPLGCGARSNAPGKLHGNVTLGGKPVTGGELIFTETGGAKNSFRATIKADGSYTASDLALGEMKVTVNTELLNPNLKEPTGKVGGAKGAQIGYRPGGDQAKGEGTYVEIPANFRNPTTTTLTVTVVAGDQSKNFDMTGP